MKTITILAIFALIFVSTATDLWFNPEESSFRRKNNDWHQLFVPCEGGSGDYDYDFDDIPAGWDTYEQGLLIPANYNAGRYQVKAVVYDI